MDGFSVGDKFNYIISIFVPEIIAGAEMALKAEMYSLDSTSQQGFLHICDPHIEEVGNFITKSNENFNLAKDDEIPHKVVKGSISMEVHTGGQGGADLANQNLILKFTAMVIPDANLVPNSVYTVVSAVTYGIDEKFIWVGSHDLKAGSLTRKSNRRASAKLMSSITSLKQGESKLLEVHVYSQHAGTSFRVELSGSDPDDNFHIGNPVIEWGEAFNCQDLDLAKVQHSKALTNKHFQKAEYTFPVMMNNDVSNPMELTSNQITVRVPITAMKVTNREIKTERLPLAILIDDTDVWGMFSDILISDKEFIPTLSQPSVTGTLLTSEPDAIYPGSSAIFQIDCSVPVNAAVELLVEASGKTGVNPVDIRLVDEGLCGRILKEERIMDGSKLIADFGICSNVHPTKATKIVIYVAYSISLTAGTQSYEVDVKVGVPISLSLEVKSAPTNTGTVIGKGMLMGFESSEITDNQEIGMNLKLKFPSNLLSEGLKLEDVPYSNDGSKNPEMHICAIRFQEIGYGSPCIHATSLTSVFESSKSGNNVSTVWDLNSMCPANLESKDKLVSLDVFYKLPIQHFPATKTIYPGVAMLINDENIFSAQFEFKAVNSQTSTSVEPYLRAKRRNMKLIDIAHGSFIFKTNPLTRGKYYLKSDNEKYWKVCKIEITKIGRNLPCLRTPTGYRKNIEYDDAAITYSKDPTQGTNILWLGTVTNWGTTPIAKDVFADDDALEIAVFIKNNGYSHNTFKTLKLLTSTSTSYQQSADIRLEINGQFVANENFKPLSPAFEFLDNSSAEAFTLFPKIVTLKLNVSEGFKGHPKIEFNVIPTQKFHLCDLRITKVGMNMPCVNTSTSLIHHRIQPDIQHYPYSSDPVENFLFLELTVLFLQDYSGSVTIQANIPETGETTSTSLNVVGAPNILSSGGFGVSKYTTYQNFTGRTREKLWVPFNITISRFSRLPLTIKVTMPSVNGAALMTVEDIRIPKESISNICCMNSKMKHLFNQTLVKSNKLTTFMQKDYAFLDLGVVVNGHYTLRNGLERESDSTFQLDVLIQVTDHPSLTSSSAHEFQVEGKSGSFTKRSASGAVVMIDRSADRISEKAFIEIDLLVNNEQESYDAGDTISLSATVFHSEFSRGEAYQESYIRLVLPEWLTFDNSETCTTNYTDSNACTFFEHENVTNIKFENGITYSDYIGINFTISVGPESRIPSELPSEIVNSTIAAKIKCKQFPFHGIPSDSNKNHVCGPYAYQHVRVSSPALKPTTMQTAACSVSASTAYNQDHLPSNVLEPSITLWSPAIRQGKIWRDFLVFDFQHSVSIGKISIKLSNLTMILSPTKVSIEKSWTGLKWETVHKEIDLPSDWDSGIVFKPLLKTEMIKIIIEDVNGKTGRKIGIEQVLFQALPVASVSETCRKPVLTTRISTETSYRHFTFDKGLARLYLCDINPHTFDMVCYSHKKGTRTFTILPPLQNIVGYHKEQQLMYFRVSKRQQQF